MKCRPLLLLHIRKYHRLSPSGLSNDVITTLHKPRVVHSGERPVITDCRYLGSYNWTNASTPTIIVPGFPPIWTGIQYPLFVLPDTGKSFIDQNAYRMPKMPLVPLIQAVEVLTANGCMPVFDWSSVDFVTDRKGLRKLWRWVAGLGNVSSSDFRIDTELVGRNTVLLVRREWSNQQRHIIGNPVSYGHNFERAATTQAESMERNTGHNRIVTYDFGGFKMVVRFEVDACHLPTHKSYAKSKACNPDGSRKDATFNLPPTWNSNSITEPPDTRCAELTVRKGGHDIPPQSSLIEIKTRSTASKCRNNGDRFPQLYLSQTPFLHVAVHTEGLFHLLRIEKLGVAPFTQEETDRNRGYSGLRTLLGRIKAMVKRYGPEGRLSLVCRNGVLKVYKRTSPDSCLPTNFLALFDPKC